MMIASANVLSTHLSREQRGLRRTLVPTTHLYGLVKLFENRGRRWKTGRYPCIEK
jgi:hypothetical protein